MPRKPIRAGAAALVALLAAAPAIAQQQAGGQAAGTEPEQTVARFIDAEGAEVGTANIMGAAAGGVLIDVQIEGLPAGEWLGFHVHETGECDPETDFESAGDHFNPDDAEHGFFTEGGPHAGDMPNQFVPEDGLLRAHVFNGALELDGEPGIRGRALVFHAEPDDYASQPSGEAGDRLACAAVE